MKKTIVAVLMVVMLATTCFAQQVEPDGIFTLEGTLWLRLGREETNSYMGFHGEEIYRIGTYSSEQFPVSTEQCSPVSQ